LKPNPALFAFASLTVVAVLPTGACAMAETLLTTPPAWVVAVDTSVPLLPVPVVLAVASWPFAVTAVAFALAVPDCVALPPVARAVAVAVAPAPDPVAVATEVALALPPSVPSELPP
jgi:hypothetical protein